MQLLLVRHALPLRGDHGEGSDPDLSETGLAQVARLPEALARFPISRVLSSPQRRAWRRGSCPARSVNSTEHVWDLLPRNQRW